MSVLDPAKRVFKPLPLHWRYLYAKLDLLDSGAPVHYQAMADKLGISRQAVWDMYQKPEFAAWVDGVLRTSNKGRVAGVIGRIGAIAERTGNVKHAELFLRTMGEIQSEAPVGAPTVTINVLGIPDRAAPETWVGGVLPDGKR